MTKGMAAMVARMNRTSAARAAYREMWVKACVSDKIEPSSKFVVFSDGNPHKAELELAAAELIRALHGEAPIAREGVCA
jgi:hypothetical protein